MSVVYCNWALITIIGHGYKLVNDEISIRNVIYHKSKHNAVKFRKENVLLLSLLFRFMHFLKFINQSFI